MTLTDLKGEMLARHANLASQLAEKRNAVILAEAVVVRARKEADTVAGALQAMERDLAGVDAVLQAAGNGVAPAVPVAPKPAVPGA